MANPPARLLNFISEQEVEEIKKKKGERGDSDSTAPDKPLFEILKENKDKQQAEFNERFKHRPPKALDEDETEFLENLEMYKRKQEKQLASEEAEQLLSFQAAVASRTIAIEEPKISFQQQKEVPVSLKEKRPRPQKSLGASIIIKAQPKKAKLSEMSSPESVNKLKTPPPSSAERKPPSDQESKPKGNDKGEAAVTQGLVSYESDSEEDND